MGPIERLRTLLKIPTVSNTDETATQWQNFQRFIDALPGLYPLTHQVLEREIIDGHSMLYRWKGSGDGDPSVLMAHYDVVPAPAAGWEHPPFAAEVVGDGDAAVIWGRGTLDDKGALVGILEAVESLVANGHVPASDVYLSFGHNEETAGSGAREIVGTLAARKIRPAFVLDEGGAVVENAFPGIRGPIAVVGVSEKGITSLELRVQQQGGHASTPPRFSATDRLARAIMRLGRRPFRARFGPVNLEMMRTLGPHARQPFRAIFANLWLTKPLLLAVFARMSDETNALIRTTRVVTELSGSPSANAIAETASATVNVRIAVGSTVDDAVAHVRRAIHDTAVDIRILHHSEPSPVSPTSGRPWRLLGETMNEIFPRAIMTPYVMLGASDSRHFAAISDHVYRFSPFEMSKSERDSLHAVNERMRVAAFLRGIAFYERLVERL